MGLGLGDLPLYRLSLQSVGGDIAWGCPEAADNVSEVRRAA